MTNSQAIDKFLRSLGIKGEEQDSVDIEYLQDIHWEEWDAIKWQQYDEANGLAI